MLVPFKTFDELMAAAVERLSQNTPINNFSPGSIARALLEVTNEHIAQFYQALDFNLAMAFVSKAEGYFLDLIGELLNCRRREGESDDNYRYRICHQVEVVAGCNATAIRLELLSIPGVRDVIMRPYTHGPGSFSVYVIPEVSGSPPASLIDVAQQVLNEKAAFGVKAVVVEPVTLSVDVRLQLVLSSGAYREFVLEQARKAVWDYIANLPPGGTLVVAELVRQAMNASADIKDAKIAHLYVNDELVPLVNQEAAWNEVFYPRVVEVVAGG